MSDLLNQQVAVVAASLLRPQSSESCHPIYSNCFPQWQRTGVEWAGDEPCSPHRKLDWRDILERHDRAKKSGTFHELIPTASVIGMFTNPGNPNTEEQAKDAQAAARALNQQLIVLPVGGEGDLDAAFTALAQQRAGALFVASDSFLFGQRNELIARAAHHSIPIISASREFPVAGGLMSYGASLADGYRQLGATLQNPGGGKTCGPAHTSAYCI